jgi:hypothetical protein
MFCRVHGESCQWRKARATKDQPIQLRECIFAPARRVWAQETLPAAFAACEVVPSTLGKSIGDVASLMAALAQQK